jgi:phosphatidylserine decarboxylase
MVRDGYWYALACIIAAVLLGWLTWSWTGPGLALIPLLLAAFFLWFFRDPERVIPTEPGQVVSPGDGKVTDVAAAIVNGGPGTRISIFLNVFDVHVNRSPIGGVIRSVQYQKGRFANAMGSVSSDSNEQNIVTVEGEGHSVIFKQIAGLLARRIVFTKNAGDVVARGERVGLIKFGSRVDVILPGGAEVLVKVGDKVAGGSSVVARFAMENPMKGPR